MNIALIAHDAKKELMIQFCTAYCGVLSRHTLVATGTTGKMVSEATGLEITKFLSGLQGGTQQIMARIACNEILPQSRARHPKPMFFAFATSITSPLLQILPPPKCLSTALSAAIWIGEIL